jgi:hypothetical protein
MDIPHDRDWQALTRDATEGAREDKPFDLEGRESLASRADEAHIDISDVINDWPEEPRALLTKWSYEQLHGPYDIESN